jgi:hypothetical protein
MMVQGKNRFLAAAIRKIADIRQSEGAPCEPPDPL